MDRLITLFNNVGIGRARPKTVTAHPEFAEDISCVLSRTTAVLHPLMGRSTWKYSTKEFQSVHTGIERVIRVPGGGRRGWIVVEGWKTYFAAGICPWSTTFCALADPKISTTSFYKSQERSVCRENARSWTTSLRSMELLPSSNVLSLFRLFELPFRRITSIEPTKLHRPV